MNIKPLKLGALPLEVRKKEPQNSFQMNSSLKGQSSYIKTSSVCVTPTSTHLNFLSNKTSTGEERSLIHLRWRLHWPTYDNSTTNLSKHIATCHNKQNGEIESQKLASVGVTGTGNINLCDVAQLCAVWCAETAQPFLALGEQAHRGILHPTVLKNLPTRKAVSRDIGILYTAVQESLIETLKDCFRAMYLGLDAWQSPGGFDVLGTVLYCLVEDETGAFELEAMPLDFVRLKERHTGVYLDKTVCLIVEKFRVQNKICGIVTNDASNNKTMIEEIKKYSWARFKGKGQWVRFFAHILNLIAQVILRPFGSHKKETQGGLRAHKSDSDNNNSDPDDTEDLNEVLDHTRGDNDDVKTQTTGKLAMGWIPNDEIELETDNIAVFSDEEDDDQYSLVSCKDTWAKVSPFFLLSITCKLNKSPNSKELLVDICREKGCLKPHNVERDVRTQWNSTFVQSSGILRCSEAILEWQKDKRHGTLQSTLSSDESDKAKPEINTAVFCRCNNGGH
ncbi:hypothetical protein PSTG_05013 [Puccinia striiformis f. sp. tritici PST-78]|uniref:DUF659 domain-containing protein n=1 Tax=Puccinia striiformis f. sp. tritici PST-78 TaxID=1165861 RepID=A0A0L0VRJ6_9BASI|nr:hypothetical protein PSTG_05013 [Puccinia striiformis f. sp. tritici PST-78]